MQGLSLLIRSADDVPGQWVAHCLNWDLVTQGDSPAHAVEMMLEAVMVAIEADLQDGLNPSDRKPAPIECWQLFRQTLSSGKPIGEQDIRDLPAGGHGVIAAIVFLAVVEKRAVAPIFGPAPEASLPPYMIAELNKNSDGAHC